MFCTRCGVKLDDSAKFCAQCGSPVGSSAYAPPAPYPKLSRPREGRKIAGVCAAFARYLGVDVTLIRVIAVILIFWPPCVGVIAYLVSWIVMPNDPLLLPEGQPAASQPANGPA